MPVSPDVSVVIPTYNRLRYLKEAIQSCFKGNDDLSVEVVIVDDGSTDGTRGWLEKTQDPRIGVHLASHGGAPCARNKGLDRARGRYIKFLADDDLLLPGALALEVQQIQAAEVDVCCADFYFIDDSGTKRLRKQQPSPDLISGIFLDELWGHPLSFMCARDAIGDVRWSNEPYFQDMAFFMKVLARRPTFTKLNAPVGLYNAPGEDSITKRVRGLEALWQQHVFRSELTMQGLAMLEEYEACKPHHVRAASIGLWRWAHIVAAFDLPAFSTIYGRLMSIDHEFLPERTSKMLQVCDRAIGPKATEYLLYPIRRAYHSF